MCACRSASSYKILKTMTDKKKTIELEPQPQACETQKTDSFPTVGVVANYPDSDETRFLLTPESSGMIVSSGIHLYIENNAAVDISFTNEDYEKFGVKTADRDKCLSCDVVLSYAPLRPEDIRKMRPHATLLCMMDNSLFDRARIDALLDAQITLGCLDNMLSHNEIPVFADIIDELDGRASVIYAQDYLSFLGGGKGVLLAGVAGLNPCEVLIIGEGNVECAAASAALDAGAYVTLMNNDISALQSAREVCGTRLNTAAIHPRVLYNKVKTADVIMLGNCTRPFEFPKKLSLAMKETVYVLDFNETHPSVTVPRTVAMALSNVLVNFFDEMLLKEGFDSMMATTPGVQSGIVTYRGQLVDKLVGAYLSMPCVDLSMMLTAAN